MICNTLPPPISHSSDLVLDLVTGLHGLCSGRQVRLLALLGEEEDGAGVGARRVAAHPRVVVEPLAAADQQNLAERVGRGGWREEGETRNSQ